MTWRDTNEAHERRETLRRARRYSRRCDGRRWWWSLRRAIWLRVPWPWVIQGETRW